MALSNKAGMIISGNTVSIVGDDVCIFPNKNYLKKGIIYLLSDLNKKK